MGNALHKHSWVVSGNAQTDSWNLHTNNLRPPSGEGKDARGDRINMSKLPQGCFSCALYQMRTSIPPSNCRQLKLVRLIKLFYILSVPSPKVWRKPSLLGIVVCKINDWSSLMAVNIQWVKAFKESCTRNIDCTLAFIQPQHAFRKTNLADGFSFVLRFTCSNFHVFFICFCYLCFGCLCYLSAFSIVCVLFCCSPPPWLW